MVLWQISLEKAVRLKHDIFCNARDNKVDIKINTQHFDISDASKKPTQNQVYSRQNHKTNSESSVFKPKSQNQIKIKCIQAKISITYQRQKKMISKTIPQPQMHWQNNNKHSFKICNK